MFENPTLRAIIATTFTNSIELFRDYSIISYYTAVAAVLMEVIMGVCRLIQSDVKEKWVVLSAPVISFASLAILVFILV